MADLVNLAKIMETPRFEPLIVHTNNRCSCIMEKFWQPEKNQRGKVVFPDRREGG